MKSIKCQASVEFMVVLGLVMAIFIMVGAVVYRNWVKTDDLKVYVFSARLANHIAGQVNALSSVGEGHETFVSIPSSLYGRSRYTLNLYPNESRVYIEGSSFSSGESLKVSSPVSLSRLRCIRSECGRGCNKTREDQCLQVNESLDLRLVNFDGAVYFSAPYNVMQEGVSERIVPFEGESLPDIASPPAFARRDGSTWNILYVHHDSRSGNMSLVFSLNNTETVVMMELIDLVGQLRGVRSNDAAELDIGGDPQAQWRGDPGSGDIDGGSLDFEGGFHICIKPSDYMPSSDWELLSSDERVILLSKDDDKPVCISVP